MKFKKTIIAKGIDDYQIDSSLNLTHKPVQGDLALFEVIELGRHETVQSDSKRVVGISPGDTILAAFANRYATSQYEGYVPDSPKPLYHILGAGGAIGIVKSKNDILKDIEPTTVKLIGYAVDPEGKVINTRYYQKTRKKFRGELPNNAKLILSIGSTMDSGKTTTAAFTSRGLKMGGAKVAFIKLTGTCFTKDADFVFDMGADVSIDFSDMGYPSTYMESKEDLMDLYQTLLDTLEPLAPDYIVMEIADGLLQRETNFLLKDPDFMKTIYKVVFSCGDSMSVFYGIQMLGELGVPLAAVCGKFTMSPLLIQEVRENCYVQPIHIEQLALGKVNYLFQ